MPKTDISLHIALIRIAKELGHYRKTKPHGLCHGFALKWLEAVLLGDEATFEARMRSIKDKPFREHSKAEQTEIRAFFDSLCLYHMPIDHIDLIGLALMQLHISELSRLAGSDAILARGGLESRNISIGLYDTSE